MSFLCSWYGNRSRDPQCVVSTSVKLCACIVPGTLQIPGLILAARERSVQYQRTFSLVCTYVLLFLCILFSSVEFISEIFSFLFATCLSVFPPPFQFPLDEVGLWPLVLWYTKNSFTSLHGKCSVIHGSNAGNARHLYMSLCYEVCCAMLKR